MQVPKIPLGPGWDATAALKPRPHRRRFIRFCFLKILFFVRGRWKVSPVCVYRNLKHATRRQTNRLTSQCTIWWIFFTKYVKMSHQQGFKGALFWLRSQISRHKQISDSKDDVRTLKHTASPAGRPAATTGLLCCYHQTQIKLHLCGNIYTRTSFPPPQPLPDLCKICFSIWIFV